MAGWRKALHRQALTLTQDLCEPLPCALRQRHRGSWLCLLFPCLVVGAIALAFLQTAAEIDAPLPVHSPSPAALEALKLQALRLMHPDNEKARLLIYVPYVWYLTMVSRQIFHMADAALGMPDVDVVVWGPGWAGWDPHKSEQENVEAAFPCGSLDVVYTIQRVRTPLAAYCSGRQAWLARERARATAPAVGDQAAVPAAADSEEGSPQGVERGEAAWGAKWATVLTDAARRGAWRFPRGARQQGDWADLAQGTDWGSQHLTEKEWFPAEARQERGHDAPDASTLPWPGDTDDRSDERPVIVMEANDCYTGKCMLRAGSTEGGLGNAHVVVYPIAHELPALAPLASSHLVAHLPFCAHAGHIGSPVPWEQRRFSVALVGMVNPYYPLRSTVARAMRAGMLTGLTRQLVHKGYPDAQDRAEVAHWYGIDLEAAPEPYSTGVTEATRFVKEQYTEYCHILRHAKIVAMDSSIYRYLVKKFPETALAGTVIASDLPPEHARSLGGAILPLPLTTNTSQVAAILNAALQDDAALRQRAEQGRKWAQQHAVCEDRVTRVLDAALAFAGGRRGTVYAHQDWEATPCGATTNPLASRGRAYTWSRDGCSCSESEDSQPEVCVDPASAFPTDPLPSHWVDYQGA